VKKEMRKLVILGSFAIASCSYFGKAPTSPVVGKPSASTGESVVQEVGGVDPQDDASADCLFALSGTFVGFGDYGDVFPKTFSGNKPARGEIFDRVGGVFLPARSRPYIYGQGNREIDKAINFTFEGLAVPKGMSVELRPSESEPSIFAGEGPLVAIEGSNTGTGVGTPWMFKDKFDSGKLNHWPLWMKNYLDTTGGKIETLPLRAAKWVKVSVIQGELCDQMQL
jgi:hypothetical protein